MDEQNSFSVSAAHAQFYDDVSISGVTEIDEDDLAEEVEAEDAVEASEEPEDSAPSANTVGVGVDVVEIARMRAILERSSHFAERVFSEEERAYCDSTGNPATHYALRFAAKEAVVKALGTGFADGIDVRDIEVQRAANGRPNVVLTGAAKRISDEQGVREMPISLTYTHTEAVAFVMAITERSVRAAERRKDPMEELAAQFKEARSLLDDIDEGGDQSER